MRLKFPWRLQNGCGRSGIWIQENGECGMGNGECEMRDARLRRATASRAEVGLPSRSLGVGWSAFRRLAFLSDGAAFLHFADGVGRRGNVARGVTHVHRDRAYLL